MIWRLWDIFSHKKIKSNPLYSRYYAEAWRDPFPRLSLGQYRSEETPQWWRAVDDTVSNLISPRIKLQTSRTVGGVRNHYTDRPVFFSPHVCFISLVKIPCKVLPHSYTSRLPRGRIAVKAALKVTSTISLLKVLVSELRALHGGIWSCDFEKSWATHVFSIQETRILCLR